jgi:hypothetical protein
VASFVRINGRMTARRLTFLVLLYVTADLSNPFMPGAFSFSAEESVEATYGGQGARRPVVASSRFKPNVLATVHRSELSRPGRSAGATTTAVDEWFVDLRRAHTPFHEPPSAADDH